MSTDAKKYKKMVGEVKYDKDLREVRRSGYSRWLIYHLFKQKLLLVFVFIGIIIVTLTRTLIPVVIGIIIDDALIPRDDTNLILILIIALTLFLIRNIMDYVTMMAGHYLGLKTEQNMRQEFFDKIQLKPLRYHDTAQAGDLQALATNDVRIINTMIAHGAFYLYPFFQV